MRQQVDHFNHSLCFTLLSVMKIHITNIKSKNPAPTIKFFSLGLNFYQHCILFPLLAKVTCNGKLRFDSYMIEFFNKIKWQQHITKFRKVNLINI